MKKGSSHSKDTIQKMKDAEIKRRDQAGKRDDISLKILKEIDNLSLEQTILGLPELAYKAIYAALRVLQEKSLCSSSYTIRTRSATYLIDKLSDEKFMKTVDLMRGKGAKVAAGSVQWRDKKEKKPVSKQRGRKSKT